MSKKSPLIEDLNSLSVEEFVEQAASQGTDLLKLSESITKALEQFNQKSNQVIGALVSKVDTFCVNMVIEAKQDCLNNFYKGQLYVITEEDPFYGYLIDNVAYIDKKTVIENFKPKGMAGEREVFYAKTLGNAKSFED